MNKIKALLLDVDGVILGEKERYNFPMPHKEVLDALRDINKKTPVILCTAKPFFSVEKIIKRCELYKAPHVCEAGALIIDAKSKKIIQKDIIENLLAVKTIKEYLLKDFYTEFYTQDNYYAQISQKAKITDLHAQSLQKYPVLVKDIVDEAKKHQIIKIIVIAKNEAEKPDIEKVFSKYSDSFNLFWGIHPIALPAHFGVITSNKVSKRISCKKVVESLGISFKNVLGVGDGVGDWDFMKMCSYTATMGNAKEELKKLVLSKGREKSFIAPSVDENGILKIFIKFNLL